MHMYSQNSLFKAVELKIFSQKFVSHFFLQFIFTIRIVLRNSSFIVFTHMTTLPLPLYKRFSLHIVHSKKKIIAYKYEEKNSLKINFVIQSKNIEEHKNI